MGSVPQDNLQSPTCSEIASPQTTQVEYDFADERSFRYAILLRRGFSLAHARIKEEREYEKLRLAQSEDSEDTWKQLKDGAKRLADGIADDARTIANDVITWPSHVLESAVYYARNLRECLTEILGGLSISIILIPEAIAFAYICEMPPMMGLYATFILGFIAAALGGRPPIVSGAAGAVAVVVKELTSSSGPLSDLPLQKRQEGLLMAMIICGVIQMLVGIFKLGSFAKVFPHSGLIGFCNGLALVLIRSQLTSFKKCSDPMFHHFDSCPADRVRWLKVDEAETWFVAMHVLIALLVMHFWRFFPKLGKIIPPSIITLIIGAAVEHGLVRAASGSNYATRTIAETAPISSVMPSWHVPQAASGSSNVRPLFEYGAYAALVGLIESIVALQLIAQIMEERATSRQMNQECFAQGLGNFVSGFFGAIGGGALLGESVLMRTTGAKGRLSTMSCAWFVIILVLIASKAINLVPVGTLSGVIVAAALHTFHWPCLTFLHKIRRSDSLIIIVVTVLALVTNLAIAAIVGTLIAAVNSMWDTSKLLHVHRREGQDVELVGSLASYENPSSNASGSSLELEMLVPLKRSLSPESATPARDACEEMEQPDLHPESDVRAGNPAEQHNAVASMPLASLELKASKDVEAGTTVTYFVEGVLFFASFRDFSSYFHPIQDPDIITIDFSHSVISDLSGVTAICGLARRYALAQKRVMLRGLDLKSSRQCKRARDFNQIFVQTGFGMFEQPVTSNTLDVTTATSAIQPPRAQASDHSTLELDDEGGVENVSVTQQADVVLHLAQEVGERNSDRSSETL